MANGLLTPESILGITRENLATGSPLAAFNRGQQTANLLQQQELQNQLLGQNVAQQAAQAPLEQQLLEQQVQAGITQQERLEIEDGARDAITALQINDPARRAAFLDRRVANLSSQGRDPSDTLALSQLPFDQQTDELNRLASVLLPASQLGAQLTGGVGRVVGTPRVFQEGGKNFFAGVRELPDGTVETFTTPIEGDLVAAGGETAVTKRTKDLEAKQQELQQKIDLAATQEEQRALGVERADIAKKIRAGAREGSKAKREITQLRDALNQLQTGRLAQARQALGGLVPGIRDASAETFNSLVNQFILSRKDELLGGGILSDADIALLQTVGPQLGNTREANLQILDAFEQAANSSIDRGVRFREFKDGGGNAEDFEMDVTQAPTQQVGQAIAPPVQNTFTSSSGIQFTVE